MRAAAVIAGCAGVWALAGCILLAGCALPGGGPATHALTISESASSIVVHNGSAHVLTYHKAEVPPPEGSSPLLARSAFLHPITAPNGGVVTGIHAADHLHHLGLWHAWVKATHKGREIDFWNLAAGTATVRYANTRALRRSDRGVGFTVTQHHVILPDEVVLEEALSIDVQVHPDGSYAIDHVTVQHNVSAAALLLPAYRYGGCIAYRGPTHWQEHNSGYLTSEGRGRDDGHATRARWCAMWGETAHGAASLTILGHPDNRDAPQRQRIWPATENRGAVFFCFVPVQETGWAIAVGEEVTMRYRVMVSDGVPERDEVEEWFGRWVSEGG